MSKNFFDDSPVPRWIGCFMWPCIIAIFAALFLRGWSNWLFGFATIWAAIGHVPAFKLPGRTEDQAWEKASTISLLTVMLLISGIAWAVF